MASLQKRSDTTTRPWLVRWLEDGRHRGRGFRTEREARHFMADIERMGAHTVVASTTTLSAFILGPWLTDHSAAWAENTSHRRAYLVDRWVLPHIGHVKLRDLGRQRIVRWRADLLRAGATPKTVNAAMRVLSACLKDAHEDGMIPGNPCRGLRPLPVERPDRRAIPASEVELIRAALPTARDRLVVSLAAWCGLRPQEIVALRWEDVHHDRLHIRRAHGLRTDKATKTSRARFVTVITPVRDDLDAVAWRDGYVVRGDRGGQLSWGWWTNRLWRPTVKVLGMDWRPYEMRHTFASALIAEGRTVVEAAAELGHSSPSTTLDHYAHLWGASCDHVTLLDVVVAARAAAGG